MEMIPFPALRSVVGATDDEFVLIQQIYRELYHEEYDVGMHQRREQPRHPVAVSPFELAKDALTNREFLAFVEDEDYHGGEQYITRGERIGHRSTWRSPVGPKKRRDFFALQSDEEKAWLDFPVTCLDWEEAMMVAHWASVRAGLIDPEKKGERLEDFLALFRPSAGDQNSGSHTHRDWPGYRLATSAEWEAASRYQPGEPDSPNPATWWWGDRLEDGAELISSSDYTSRARFRKWVTCPWQGTHIYAAPVDARPAMPNGLRQMAGNVWEWCLDTFDPQFYTEMHRRSKNDGSGEEGAATLDPICLLDPQELDEEGALIPARRIARGGGWHNLPANIRQASRRVHEPGRIRCNLGLRLARSLESG